MEEQEIAAGAPGAEETRALSVLENWDEAPAPQADDADPSAEDEADEAEDVELEAGGDDEDQSEAPEEDKPEPKHRLRDGEEVPLGELKKAYGARKEIEAAKQQFEAEKASFQQKIAVLQQQEQFFTQQMPMVLHTLRHQVPPMPDKTMLQTDPLNYVAAKEAHEDGVKRFQYAQQAMVVQQRQSEAQRAKAQQAYRETELQKLVEAEPALRDSKAIQQLDADIRAHLGHYGFSAEDYVNVDDHRAMRVLADAVKYRKLQAEKPKAIEKAKEAPPTVQAPARRRSTAEFQAQATREQLSKLRNNPRSAKAAEDFLSRFE